MSVSTIRADASRQKHGPFDGMRRHEWNHDRSALEDAQPCGERRGAMLETQCDSVALLHAICRR
jgi:hypothetical protein